MISKLASKNYYSACRVIYVFLIISCCFSCKKECLYTQSTPFVTDTCILIPPISGSSTGYNIIYDSIDITSPCFNPNNNNEFLCIISINNSKCLYSYNMLTESKRIIYEGEILSSPSWGKNDWILFNLSDNNIWKIKSNGDSLTRITSSGGYFHPTWSPDAKYFMYTNPDYQNKVTIVDADNNIVKVLPTTKTPSWGENNILIYNDNHGVYFYHLENDSIYFKWFEYGFNGGGFVWINDYEAIYTGISLYNLEQTNAIIKINRLGDTCLIKPYCNGWSYNERTYSRTKNKVIFIKVTYELIHELELFRKSKIVIMNPNGTNETKIQVL